jgi:hypothetical protein
MLVEYVAFGTLVIVALVATFIGLRRRRAEAVVDPSAAIPFLGDGGASAGHSSTQGEVRIDCPQLSERSRRVDGSDAAPVTP